MRSSLTFFLRALPFRSFSSRRSRCSSARTRSRPCRSSPLSRRPRRRRPCANAASATQRVLWRARARATPLRTPRTLRRRRCPLRAHDLHRQRLRCSSSSSSSICSRRTCSLLFRRRRRQSSLRPSPPGPTSLSGRQLSAWKSSCARCRISSTRRRGSSRGPFPRAAGGAGERQLIRCIRCSRLPFPPLFSRSQQPPVLGADAGGRPAGEGVLALAGPVVGRGQH